MAKRGGKSKGLDDLSEVLNSYVNVVNAAFERFTGKSVAAWLEEFRQRPQELPPGGEVSSSDTMSLVNAYSILGLTPNASLAQVKTHYRNLANVFHSDKGAMNDEAMKLLNRAYERITKGVR